MPLVVTVPWAPSVTAVTVRVWPDSLAGPVLSLARTLVVTEPSSATVAVSLTASGVSLTSVTVTLTVAVSLLGSATPLVVPLSVIV